jgi:hypothetical protein
MFILLAMNVLTDWLKENGVEGRKLLFEALKEEFPRFSQTSLSQYKLGKRLPDKKKAEIIAKIIGVAVESIPHRVTHWPSCPEFSSPEAAESFQK